jgi:hypothetical protein
MYLKIKVSHLVVGVLLLSSVLWVGIALAGSPDSTGEPSTTSSYSLEDVYQRLDAGAAGSSDVFTEPSTAPGTGTMHTINEIMAVAPAVDNTNGAARDDVVAGKTYWGLRNGAWGLQTGEGVAAPIPKTGQTIPHTTGDDGDLQMGVAWPTPRFITGTTGVVTDTLTGLIWLENSHCAQDYEDWSDALLNYIYHLNADGTMNTHDCGDTSNGGTHQTDWRLPNVRELQSLVHYGFYNPPLPNTAGTGQYSQGDPFIGVQPLCYWTSTGRAAATPYAWSVNMDSGALEAKLKTSTCAVWAVRGGQ